MKRSVVGDRPCPMAVVGVPVPVSQSSDESSVSRTARLDECTWFPGAYTYFVGAYLTQC